MLSDLCRGAMRVQLWFPPVCLSHRRLPPINQASSLLRWCCLSPGLLPSADRCTADTQEELHMGNLGAQPFPDMICMCK